MKIVIGSDHAGLDLKEKVKKILPHWNIVVEDIGCFTPNSCDYPDFGAQVAQRVSEGKNDKGILICNSGIGMSMVANKFAKVRAALCYNAEAAQLSRSHNDANILVLGSHFVKEEALKEILSAFFDTPFESGRHLRRIEKIERAPMSFLKQTDPEIHDAIQKEILRQETSIELIASENFVSQAVMEAQGSVLTNKYAEGYPAKRWYNGCENVDVVEQLAIHRALRIFGAEGANVQPHSGSQANMAAYFALLNPGDTVLAMSLDHGGHLTHGNKFNFSGRFYNFVSYGVSKQSEQLDYDEIEKLAFIHKPKMITAGASAYSRIILFDRLKQIADKVGALLMVDMAHIAGLVAAGLHPSPVPYSDIVTTTTHKTLRGPRGGLILFKKQFEKAINAQIFPGIQGGPLEHVIAAKAVAFQEALQPAFLEYQKQIIKNAQAMAGQLSALGLRIISGGTDNHMMLVDMSSQNTTGKDAANALHEARITANKNLIPFDTQSSFVTSGIRLGTPAVTTRGMKEKEMEQIASWIVDVCRHRENKATLEKVSVEVEALCKQFPLYPNLSKTF